MGREASGDTHRHGDPLQMREFVEKTVGPLAMQRDGAVARGSESRPR